MDTPPHEASEYANLDMEPFACFRDEMRRPLRPRLLRIAVTDSPSLC